MMILKNKVRWLYKGLFDLFKAFDNSDCSIDCLRLHCGNYASNLTLQVAKYLVFHKPCNHPSFQRNGEFLRLNMSCTILGPDPQQGWIMILLFSPRSNQFKQHICWNLLSLSGANKKKDKLSMNNSGDKKKRVKRWTKKWKDYWHKALFQSRRNI